jgi:hypothetical protein
MTADPVIADALNRLGFDHATYLEPIIVAVKQGIEGLGDLKQYVWFLGFEEATGSADAVGRTLRFGIGKTSGTSEPLFAVTPLRSEGAEYRDLATGESATFRHTSELRRAIIQSALQKVNDLFALYLEDSIRASVNVRS